MRETRELMERYYPHVPYGMWVGNQVGDTMNPPLLDTSEWYTLDLSWWPVGVYRVNLHTVAGVESPFGSKLHPNKRDQDYPWSPLKKFSDELRIFLHQKENRAGYSLRFLIRPDRTIKSLGDTEKQPHD